MAVITDSVYCPECCGGDNECRFPVGTPYEELVGSIYFNSYGTINKNEEPINLFGDGSWYLVYGDINNFTGNGLQPLVGYIPNRGWGTLIDFAATGDQPCLLYGDTNNGIWGP